MPGLSTWKTFSRLARVVGILLLVWGGIKTLPTVQAQTGDKSPEIAQGRPELRVTSNLVLVRVVVRDDKGNPVEGLTKEDFRIFDRGKEQIIAQFEEHSAASAVQVRGHVPPSSPETATESFLALYFDDLHASEGDLVQARDAVDKYLANHLQPQDRVAIFTSGGLLCDFTSDLKQIHEAMLKLRANPRAIKMTNDCPSLSEYEASEIIRTPFYDPNNDAWKTAMYDASRCLATPLNGPSPETAVNGPSPLEELIIDQVKAAARHVVDEAQLLERSSLGGLELAVRTTSQMPGRRTVIMVSAGFMSDSERPQLNRITDQALRSQVVVSSLDPAGLVVGMREADASQVAIPTGAVGGAAHSLDKQQEMLTRGVLAEIAEGTGGEFFHNNNDVGSGFATLLGSPTYYTLTFVPTELKQDGKFHALRVTLAHEHTDLKVQARSGYFAASNQPESTVAVKGTGASDAAAGSPQPSTTGTSATDPATHEQLREALFAKTDTSQLVVTVEVKLGDLQGEMHELSAVSHLDGKNLAFRKEGGNSLNTVTFLFAVFDTKGTLLAHQQKHVDLLVPDVQMSSFLSVGVNEDATFQLKPGSYRLREVVVDAVEHRMTSLSRNVKVL
jgi:VWFA-related protein